MNINYINIKIDEYLYKNSIEVIDGNNGISFDMSIKKDNHLNSIEIFTIPDKALYDLFKSCIDLIKDYVKSSEINFERNYFYLKSNLISDNKYSEHLFAPEFKNTFFGIINLSNENLEIQTSGSTILINPGQTNIFNSKDRIKIVFKDGQRALSFNVSSFEFLDSQKPNTWLPIV